MTQTHDGGCLCGAIRYRTVGDPIQTTICHCAFCQRLTGSAFLVEPVFRAEAVSVSGASPKTYALRSAGSGKQVTVSFCGCCGTSLMLGFERFPGFVGLCGGAFDDPSWFVRDLDASRHIFTRKARLGVVLPAGIPLYADHALAADGAPNAPFVLGEPRVVDRSWPD